MVIVETHPAGNARSARLPNGRVRFDSGGPLQIYLTFPQGASRSARMARRASMLEHAGECEKCGRKSRSLINKGTAEYPHWICGSCLHREERRANTREKYGRGRRGY
jgi:hypothetical protein